MPHDVAPAPLDLVDPDDFTPDADEQAPDGNRIQDEWSRPPPRREWLVEGYMPAGRVADINGDGGGGKTKVVLQLAHNIAAEPADGDERRWFEGGPRVVGPAPVVFVTWEDDHFEMARRMLDNPAYQTGGARRLQERLGGRFAVVDAGGEEPLWSPEGGRSYGRLTKFGKWIQVVCEERKARLLVIDARDSAFACEENDRAAVRAFIANWDAWGRRTGCTPLLISHTRKMDSSYSGSTAWKNGVRSMMTFERPDEYEDRAILSVTKLNYGRRPRR